MELYETDSHELQNFILSTKVEDGFTEEYLILYNFAEDCKYAEYIAPDLIQSLLPFYYQAIEEAVLHRNRTAMDIYCEFNTAIFFNQKNFRKALDEESYQCLMEYYVEQTIRKMEMQNLSMLEWVSLFNTTIAFGNENIKWLFQRISEGSIQIRFSFFQYLTVLLFKESDNLLAENELREYWTSSIWDFDEGCCLKHFSWNEDAVAFYDREINRERIETLFEEVKPAVYDILGMESVELFCEEMDQSFATGVFSDRKSEYLKKINTASEYRYWDTTF